MQAEAPFDGFSLYLTTRKDGRVQAILQKRGGKSTRREQRTMLLSRYRMCVKEGRILERYEEVDHIDQDPANDALENLRILSHVENMKACNEWVGLVCPLCQRSFRKLVWRTHLRTGRDATFCSGSCRSKYYRNREKVDAKEE